MQNEIVGHKLTSEKLKKSEELFRTMVETIPFAIILTNTKNNTILYINHKTEEMLRKLMYAIPDAVIVTDLCDYITFANNSAYSILGYTDESTLISKDVLSLISQDDKEKAQANILKIFDGYSTPQEYTHIRKNGTTFDGEVNGTILRGENSSPFGIVYVIRDITERKKDG